MQTKHVSPGANGGHSHSFANRQSRNGSGPPALSGKAKRPEPGSEGAHAPKEAKATAGRENTQVENERNGSTSKSWLLADERFGAWQPSVVKAVGLNGAIVLQQLHYRLTNPDNGRVCDGERWIYNTYEQWQENDFPIWSVRHIKRAFQVLEKRKLILSCQPEGRASRRKYYRIDYGVLEKAMETSRTRTRSKGPKVAHRKGPKVALPVYRDDNAAETTCICKPQKNSKRNELTILGRGGEFTAPPAFSGSRNAIGTEHSHEAEPSGDGKGITASSSSSSAPAIVSAPSGNGKRAPSAPPEISQPATFPGAEISQPAPEPDYKLRGKSVNDLKRLRDKLQDERNAVFRAAKYDPLTNQRVGLDKARMAELRRQLDAIDAELER